MESIGKMLSNQMTENGFNDGFTIPQYEEPIAVDIRRNDYAKIGIGKRYYHANFGEIVNDNARICQEYAEHFEQYREDGVGLILRGNVGNGKTTLAVAIAKHVYEKGYKVLFVAMPSLMDTLRSMFGTEKGTEYEKRLRKVDLLILDDFGAEYSNSDFIANKVDSIVTDRYNAMLPMVITSNLSVKDIYANYNQRIYDRLKATCKILNFSGDSQRKAMK